MPDGNEELVLGEIEPPIKTLAPAYASAPAKGYPDHLKHAVHAITQSGRTPPLPQPPGLVWLYPDLPTPIVPQVPHTGTHPATTSGGSPRDLTISRTSLQIVFI